MSDLPTIIQGGMGVAVSSWKLAKAVACEGQLGVVSGTAIDSVIVRRLQDGDQGGHIRRALLNFPDQEISQKILSDYFIENGKEKLTPYRRLPLHSIHLSKYQQQLLVVSAFVEVFLAKENHFGLVGINLLEKIQIPNLAILYGAMMANVDYVLMGAGIPREIPGALDLLSKNQEASIKIDVLKNSKEYRLSFNPSHVFPNLNFNLLKRPKFLAIISSYTLASHLLKKSTGTIDGFVIEGPLAGGHNAPPRGPLMLDLKGAPIYSEKDDADLESIKKLDRPFWLAGSFGSNSKLNEAISKGATGIQVGTAFAFCEESGMSQQIKSMVVEKLMNEHSSPLEVFTDPNASPTGFPFKVASIPHSLSCKEIYDSRERICDIGLLREIIEDEQGQLVYRCPAEPVTDFIRKGGEESKACGRKCLCNCLMASVGLGQIQKKNYQEPFIVTAGDDIISLAKFTHDNRPSFTVKDVISQLNNSN